MNMPTTVGALVEHLRDADQGREKDMWETADLTLAAIADKLPEAAKDQRSGTPRPSFNSEAAREAAREIRDAVRDEGILVNGGDAKARTLLDWAETAHVWSAEDRVPEASFYAHRALNSPKYNGYRQQRLLRLREKAPNGRVTETAVRMWIRDGQPAEKQSFLEKVERRIRLAVKSAAAPWERTVEDDRIAIAKMLRVIATEIEAGDFH
jgi:hypothetical protein